VGWAVTAGAGVVVAGAGCLFGVGVTVMVLVTTGVASGVGGGVGVVVMVMVTTGWDSVAPGSGEAHAATATVMTTNVMPSVAATADAAFPRARPNTATLHPESS
jgi:hypothetical protein